MTSLLKRLGAIMNKILIVAIREFVESVKTRTFWISLFSVFFIFGVIYVMNSKLQKNITSGPRSAIYIYYTDMSGELSESLNQAFEQHNSWNPQRELILREKKMIGDDVDAFLESVKEQFRKDEVFRYIVIDKGVLDQNGKIHFYTRKPSDISTYETVGRLINNAVFNKRLEDNNISADLVTGLRKYVPMEQIDMSKKKATKSDVFASMMVPFLFLFMMFMGVFGTSQGLLTSVIEEKGSRVMEVLLSSLSPFQLMTGKVLGLSAVGLFLILIYSTVGYAAFSAKGYGGLFNAQIIILFIAYYIPGFLLLASIIAAIGSTCNTIKEAQNLIIPINLLFIIPLMGWVYFAQNPNSTLSTVLSFFPPITPMIMILRIAVMPDLPVLQVVLSLLLLVISVPLVMWGAARIFRVGVLMYGKPPKLKDIFHWMKYN